MVNTPKESNRATQAVLLVSLALITLSLNLEQSQPLKIASLSSQYLPKPSRF